MQRTYILETINDGLLNMSRLTEEQMEKLLHGNKNFIEDVKNTGIKFDIDDHRTIRRELYGIISTGEEFFPDIVDKPCNIQILCDGENMLLRIFCGQYDIYDGIIISSEVDGACLKTMNPYGYRFEFNLLERG